MNTEINIRQIQSGRQSTGCVNSTPQECQGLKKQGNTEKPSEIKED